MGEVKRAERPFLRLVGSQRVGLWGRLLSPKMKARRAGSPEALELVGRGPPGTVFRVRLVGRGRAGPLGRPGGRAGPGGRGPAGVGAWKRAPEGARWSAADSLAVEDDEDRDEDHCGTFTVRSG